MTSVNTTIGLVIEQYDLTPKQCDAAKETIQDIYSGLPGPGSDTYLAYTSAHRVCAYMERVIKERESKCS